jgi:hypothetical protein
LPISKGYDADELVKWIQQTGALVVTPPRSNRTVLRDYDKALYKEFNLVERICGYLKHLRLVTIGYAKTVLIPLVHPARGFSYFWIKSLSTEPSKRKGGAALHRKGGSRLTPEERKRNTYFRALVIYADNTFEISRHVADVIR